MSITEQDIAAQDKRLADGIGQVSRGIDKLKADRAASKHYAAILYAITGTRPDMPVDERAALADAISTCQLGRGLVDRDW